MKIYTKGGELALSQLTFSDSQPHLKVETFDREFDEVTIEMALDSPDALLRCLLASNVLRQSGYTKVNLDIRYLLGARMDRAISVEEPFTLEVIARLLNGAGLSKIRILDVHSDVALRLLRNASNILPFAAVGQVMGALPEYPLICAPDKGASERAKLLGNRVDIRGLKFRDMATGKLSGFDVEALGSLSSCIGKDVLIIDDICDRGGTFIGLVKVLKKKLYAKRVTLFVTHGIFPGDSVHNLLDGGIHTIYTTNSLPTTQRDGVIRIPVSMKEL